MSAEKMTNKELLDAFAREVLGGCDKCFMPLADEILRRMTLFDPSGGER